MSSHTDEADQQPTRPSEGDLGDGPSSHETAGQFPGGEPQETAEGDLGDGPSSHETAGQFPADEVAATKAGEESAPPEAPPESA